MGDPVYAKEGPGLVAKALSLAMAGWFAWFILSSGSMKSSASWVIALPALGAIWFPEMVAQFCSERISTKTAAQAGWVGLTGLTLAPLIAWLVEEGIV